MESWEGAEGALLGKVLAYRVRLSSLLIQQRLEPFKVASDLYNAEDFGKPTGLTEVDLDKDRWKKKWHWAYPNGRPEIRPDIGLSQAKAILATGLKLNGHVVDMCLCLIRPKSPEEDQQMYTSGIRFRFKNREAKVRG